MAIQNSAGELHCGGVLTSSKTIATAAHCFMDKATGKKMDEKTIQSFSVVAGTDKPFLYHCKLYILYHYKIE